MSDELKVSIGAQSVQLAMNPSGLVGPDGKIKSNLHLDSGQGSHSLNLPAEAFPFLVPNTPVLVIITVVQVRSEDKPAPISKLIGVN